MMLVKSIFTIQTNLVLGTIATLLTTLPVSASSFATYTDRSQWESAVNSNPLLDQVFTETFDVPGTSIQPGTIFQRVILTADSIEIPGSGIVATGEGATKLSPNTFNSITYYGPQNGRKDSDGLVYFANLDTSNQYESSIHDRITWKLPKPIFAFFGTFLEAMNGAGLQLVVHDQVLDLRMLGDQEFRNGKLRPALDTFFGIVSDTPFDSIVLQSNPNRPFEEGFGIDNFSFATATAVPEPLTILGAGTAIAFGTTFKRKLGQTKKN